MQVTAEEEVTPRREDVVPCASLYHYSLAGWRIDQDRMRRVYGGDRGEPHRNPQPSSGTPLCYIYRWVLGGTVQVPHHPPAPTPMLCTPCPPT